MADPCRQEPTIATLQATIKSISDTLLEMKEGQKRFITVLEHIASQGESINHLKADAERLEKDVNNLFGRVRELEIAPGAEGNKIKTGFVLAVISAVVSLVVAIFARIK